MPARVRWAGRLSLSILLLATQSCIAWKSDLDQALADVAFHKNKQIEAENKLKAAQAEIAALQAKMGERDAKLNELNASQADLQAKLDEVKILNTALQDRLQKAGQNVSQLSNEKGAMAAELADTRKRLEELKLQQAAAEARARQFQDLIKRFEKLADAGKLKIVMRDGRMIIELPNDVLFDSSRSDLKTEGKGTIREIAKVLKTMPDRRFQVAGHTDNIKIQTAKFPSNWELSTARAVEVVKILVESGVATKNVSAAGYGEFDPVAPNDTPEGRAKNRRIEITLVPNLDEFVKPSSTTPAPAPAAPAPAAPAKPGAKS